MPTPLLTKYFQTFTLNAVGEISIAGILNVAAYSKINLELLGTPIAGHVMQVEVFMGVLSGQTVGGTVLQFPLTTTGIIHSFNVVGPEMSIVITGGPPNTSLAIQAWTFMQ
ncbi:hypothetical protein [Granulicella tundricola]|uniref:Uncharacterized protein n=1 Tax=Granulicella tundricola (strain ATCC BAA-1859 / DSM 23138 / MP5ACTX9) TaxID=1198114 RepID=E8X6Q7_GRATM|nr:hypothetical protein [Granulicella tundricola]ADW71207.1 hypothetical protein AciX9_3931 [Granulicella tundricola MP5ACTX9]